MKTTLHNHPRSNSLLIKLFVLFTFLCVASCKKDKIQKKNSKENYFSYTGTQPKLKAIISELQKLDDQTDFTKNYQGKGLLDWDKALSVFSFSRDSIISYRVPFVSINNSVNDYLEISRDSLGKINNPILVSYQNKFSEASSFNAKAEYGNTLKNFNKAGLSVNSNVLKFNDNEDLRIKALSHLPKRQKGALMNVTAIEDECTLIIDFTVTIISACDIPDALFNYKNYMSDYLRWKVSNFDAIKSLDYEAGKGFILKGNNTIFNYEGYITSEIINYINETPTYCYPSQSALGLGLITINRNCGTSDTGINPPGTGTPGGTPGIPGNGGNIPEDGRDFNIDDDWTNIDLEMFNDPDDHDYQEYQNQTPWPIKERIIKYEDWVGFRRDAYGNQVNCLILAKEQLAKAQYKISGYDPGRQTFQVYTSQTGVSSSITKQAISYMIDAINNNIPIIVGIDNRPGSPNGNSDYSTDHFVVINGSGIDGNGKYFTFLDSSTNVRGAGASYNNKLYYDPSTGKISGTTDSAYGHSSGSHDYIVTQVRKSIPK